MELIQQEIAILTLVQHKNIVELIETFESDKVLLMINRELYNRIFI